MAKWQTKASRAISKFAHFIVLSRTNDANKLIDWLNLFFIETVIGPGIDKLSYQINSRNAP